MPNKPGSNVKIFCCLSMKKTSFYLLINAIDIILVGLLTTFLDVSITTDWAFTKKLSSASFKISGFVLWVLSVIALVFYFVVKSYSTLVHKVYSIARIIVSAIRLFIHSCGCLIIFLMISWTVDGISEILDARIFILLTFPMLFLTEAINLVWSCKLTKIVFEHQEVEDEQNNKANNVDARVPLEFQHSGSVKTRPEIAKNEIRGENKA